MWLQQAKKLAGFGIALLAIVLVGCAGYGGETVGVGSPGVVRSDSEYCELTLPEGWTWYPARWAAESPGGTRMLFEDARYGRPENPEWDEVTKARISAVRERNPEANVEANDTSLSIDYGAEAGLAYLQRFDTIGCQVTFSNARRTRVTESALWRQIINSIRRISPDPKFTPPSGP